MSIREALHTAVAALVSVVFLLPLVWMVAASLREPGLPAPYTVEWIPSPLTPSNYPRLFEMLPFGRYVLNSLAVVAVSVPLTLLTASWAGLAMALVGPRARQALFVASVLVMMVPVTAVWLVRYVLFARLDLLDTMWALTAPAFAGSSPFFVLLYFWSFRRIPRELFDHALLEGAGPLRLWGNVAMPLAGPTTLAVGVLAAVLYWSDFISPLLYLKTESHYTLAVGLQQLQQLDRTNWPLLMAAATLMTAPVIGLFLLMQRWALLGDFSTGVEGRG